MAQAIGPSRVDQPSRRDGQADEEEHDRRQQVGEELPDRVDRVGAGLRHRPARAEVAEDDRGGDGRDDAGQVELVGEQVARRSARTTEMVSSMR